MSVPLIEQGGASADSRETVEQVSTDGSGPSPDGPTVSFSTRNGAQYTLTASDLQTYLAVIQTALLLYVTVKEARA